MIDSRFRDRSEIILEIGSAIERAGDDLVGRKIDDVFKQRRELAGDRAQDRLGIRGG